MIQYFLALQLIRLVFSQDFCDITLNETAYSAFNLGDKVIIRNGRNGLLEILIIPLESY